ncbi:MAG: hypothetical protein ABEI74_02890 [Candidatus Pacearchaeota archaeon]
MAKKKEVKSKKSSSNKSSKKNSNKKSSVEKKPIGRKNEVKGEWHFEGKKYIVSYTSRKPNKNEVILTPEQLIKKIVKPDRQLLVSIKKGTIKKDKLHILRSTRSNLERGEIVGTKEAIIRKFQNIEERFKNLRHLKYQVLDNLYTATVESGQAYLLKEGYPVDSPRDIPKALSKAKAPNLKEAKEVIKTFKDFEHGDINLPSGKKINELFEKSVMFSNEVSNK